MKSIKLAIANSYPLFRETVKCYLEIHEDINVVFDVSDLQQLLNNLEISDVEVLLVDIYLPLFQEKEALKIIREKYPKINILVLTIFNDDTAVENLLDFGVRGFISATDNPGDLIRAIRIVSSNQLYRNSLLTNALYKLRELDESSRTGRKKVLLNDREKGVLRMLWEEKMNKEIANEIYLSIRSVEKIKQDMKEKLGIKSTVGLLKYAIEEQIIIPKIAAEYHHEPPYQ